MNFKDTLYFISKCLTINYDDSNHEIIETKLKSTKIDWDKIVKLSTSHLVLPALYKSLKKVNFLKYLPNELVDYMIFITSLNEQRNIQVITQIRKLNKLLNDNNITPIFMKGAANLISGLYTNISERMVGDIDFILSKNDYDKAIKVLRTHGYNEVDINSFHMNDHRHYSPLKNDDDICAIEIHSRLTVNKFHNEFNFDSIIGNIQIVDGIKIMSDSDNLILSIISHQINDNGFFYKTIALRNAYDVFLLSKIVNVSKSIDSLNKLFHPLNCFIAICFDIFNNPDSLNYKKSPKVNLYLTDFILHINNEKRMRNYHHMISFFIFFKTRLNIIYKSLFYKQYRNWLLKRIIRKIG